MLTSEAIPIIEEGIRESDLCKGVRTLMQRVEALASAVDDQVPLWDGLKWLVSDEGKPTQLKESKAMSTSKNVTKYAAVPGVTCGHFAKVLAEPNPAAKAATAQRVATNKLRAAQGMPSLDVEKEVMQRAREAANNGRWGEFTDWAKNRLKPWKHLPTSLAQFGLQRKD